MRILLLLSILAIAACGDRYPFPHAPRPVAVTLTQDMLTVRMLNGETCRGPRPAEATGGWAGQLQGCSANYDYHIVGRPGTNPVRLVFTRVRHATGLGSTVVPLADVTISDGGGRDWQFNTPARQVR